MSLNLTVTIPLEKAAILRQAHDLRTSEEDIDSALFTVANAVIDAVKALPWSITSSAALLQDRTMSPYGVLTPPSSTYSKDSSGYCESQPFPDFSSASGVSSRSTSATTPFEEFAESGSWWSAKEECTDEFSIDVCNVVNGEEEIYYLSVTGNMSLDEVGFRVEQLSGVPIQEQRLVWRGYRLNQPDAALNTYGITDGSKIYLFQKAQSVDTLPDFSLEEDRPLPPNPGYEITVQTVGGKLIPVIVQGQTTTAELASSIFDKQGICPGLQRLVHRGRVVFDGYAYDQGEACLIYTMEELGIGPETIVSLYFCNTMR